MSDAGASPLSSVEARPSRVAKIMLPLILLGAVFCCTFKLGLPVPHNDDLYFLGAGFELAKSARLENPLIRLQELSTREFFSYPPMYPYLVAGWARVFGVSYNSLAGFFSILVTVATVSLAVIAHPPCLIEARSKGSLLLLGALAGLVLLAFASLGFRPESSGFAILVLAVAVLLSTERWYFRFLAFVAIGLALLCAPRLLYAVFFGAGIPILKLVRTGRLSGGELLWSGVVALVAVTLFFLAMIDFRLSAFFRGFNENYSRIDYQGWRQVSVWTMLTAAPAGRLAFLGYSAAFLGIAANIRSWRFIGGGKYAVLAAAFSLYFLWFMRQVPVYPGLAAISLALVLAVTASGQNRRLLAPATLVLAGLGLSPAVVQVLQLVRTDKNFDSSAREAIAETIRPPNYLAVDMYAARYIFDYRLPENAVVFEFCRKFPDMRPKSAHELPAGAYLVCSLPELIALNFLGPETRFVPLSFHGMKFKTFPESINPFVLLDAKGFFLQRWKDGQGRTEPGQPVRLERDESIARGAGNKK